MFSSSGSLKVAGLKFTGEKRNREGFWNTVLLWVVGETWEEHHITKRKPVERKWCFMALLIVRPVDE